jgi:hypothetical protein
MTRDGTRAMDLDAREDHPRPAGPTDTCPADLRGRRSQRIVESMDKPFGETSRADASMLRALDWGDLGPTTKREAATPDLVRLTARIGALDASSVEVLGKRWSRLVSQRGPQMPVVVWANTIYRWYTSAISGSLAFEPRFRAIDAVGLVLERAGAAGMDLPMLRSAEVVADLVARLPGSAPTPERDLDDQTRSALTDGPESWSAALLAGTAAMVADVGGDPPDWVRVWLEAALAPDDA